MGWLFGWDTRKQLADHLINDNGVKTIKHCFKGNNIWAVQEYTYPIDYRDPAKAGTTVRFIALYLIKGPVFGKGHLRDGWGYKDMDESAGPYYHNCPVSYLDMVPDPGSHATEWRAKVRELAERSKRKLVEGQKISLYGQEYTVGEKVGRCQYIWQYTAKFNLPPRMMKDVEVLS